MSIKDRNEGTDTFPRTQPHPLLGGLKPRTICFFRAPSLLKSCQSSHRPCSGIPHADCEPATASVTLQPHMLGGTHAAAAGHNSSNSSNRCFFVCRRRPSAACSVRDHAWKRRPCHWGESVGHEIALPGGPPHKGRAAHAEWRDVVGCIPHFQYLPPQRPRGGSPHMPSCTLWRSHPPGHAKHRAQSRAIHSGLHGALAPDTPSALECGCGNSCGAPLLQLRSFT